MKFIVNSLLLCFLLNITIQLKAQDIIKYLALGDSYTIGESVQEFERWPDILVEKLTSKGVAISLDKIIATTGWTTDELIAAINTQTDELKSSNYGLVSLLIGVNNQYRGYSIAQYEKEFESLLSTAIDLAGKKSKNVFVVSIPDYGVTPFALDNGKNTALIAKELALYNQTARKITEKYGVNFYDITPISLKALWDKAYIAEDLLHPSGKMYADWVDYISPAVYQMLMNK